MRALVLIGGEGTRLRPLTFSQPKSMLPVAGRPMITQTIEWLASHGIDEVIFSLGYRPDAFQAAFPDASHAGVRIAYAIEPELLDTAGAIRFAATFAGAVDERLVVVNGDVLTDLDLTSLVAFHEGTSGEGTINLTPVEDPSRFGVVPTDESGRVLAFIEKPSRESAPTNAINAGTYVLEPAVLARIASDRRVSIEREVFPSMVEDGVLFARLDQGYWIDTGTPATFLQAQFDILSGLRPDVRLPDHEAISPGVLVAPGARLGGTATAPVLLCEGAVVEPGAVVERVVLGAGAVVEAGATVRDSVLLEGAVIGEGSTVEGSILGARARVGVGSRVVGTSIVGFDVELPPESALDGARVPG